MRIIKGFDGLRGLSILTVVFTHLGVYDRIFDYNANPRLPYLIHGTTGVTLFFTISGFLITLLLLRERKETGRIDTKNFYVRRFLRLLPPLIVFFAIIIYLTMEEKIAGSMAGLLMSVFYLYNFMPKMGFTGELTHTWSLAVEEQFYLTWPWVLAFVRTNEKIFTIILTLVVTCVLFKYYMPEIQYQNSSGETVYLIGEFQAGRWFIPAVAPIIMGSFVAFVVFYYPSLFKNTFVAYVSAIAALFLYLAPLWIPKLVFDLSNFVQAAGFSILMALIYNYQNNLLTLSLEFKPLAFIGKISYGIYIYQGIFLCTGPYGELWMQKYPQNVILTLLISVVSYYLVEKPFLKIKDRFRSTKENVNPEAQSLAANTPS